MPYFIIYRPNRDGTPIGVSEMPMPLPGIQGSCRISIQTEEDRGAKTFTVKRNQNFGFPIEWIDVYHCREITQVEFENYREMRVFRPLRDNYVGDFIRKYIRKKKIG